MENTKMKKKKKGKFKFFIIIILLLGASVAFFGKNYYDNSLKAMDTDSPTEVPISIPASSSSMKIGEILYEEGLIKQPLIFRYRIKEKGVAKQLKAGDYNLSTGMDLDDIIDSLTKGGKSYNTLRFTIPEGYEIRQIAEKLSKDGIVDKDRFLTLVNDKSNFEDIFAFLKELPKGQNLEGFLYPSTYEIFEESSEEEVISKMLAEFEHIYEQEVKPYIENTGLDFNEVITLASIVEREGKVDEERPIMAAVFYNRIEQGMMLQSCATVQYILGERKEVLSNEDTRTPSPFNTYINNGLPPSPIASPGKTSLIAAVKPADVDYLFFVLTGKDGTHTFSKTYKEHLQAKPKN